MRAGIADGLARVHAHDRGSTSIPATAGYHRPTGDLDRGYGLWIAGHLADVITTHTDRDGTTITLDFPYRSSVATPAGVWVPRTVL